MVRILTGIYTVKIYQGPVRIVEDILHLEIVMGSVDNSIFFLKKDSQKKNLQASQRNTFSQIFC